MDSHSPSKISTRASNAKTKPSPKQPSPKRSPVKASSKLALMKKRADEEEQWRKSEEEEKKSKRFISSRKEPIAPASSETAATPKTGVSAGRAKHVSTPKSEGGSTKTSPTKPEVKAYIKIIQHVKHF